ncbi:MAG: hypothetical protein FWD73_04995 [Polyangiaceae bacterium]|nr:hypothetical protein [Polyangiaceae bacterium]
MRSRHAALGLAIACALCIISVAHAARAAEVPLQPSQESDADALFRGATDALASGRPVDAIAGYEALGDRGMTNAVISYNRGLAYAARVRAHAEQAGDLGRATAGFEEARDLSHDKTLVADASKALTEVRAEIARRRAHAGDPIELEHGTSFGRSVAGLLGENAWAMVMAFSSIALSIGIAVRVLGKTPRGKVKGTTTAVIASAILIVTSFLVLFAQSTRKSLREGVIITPHARLLDDRHIAKSGLPALPEGARVRLFDHGPEFVRVETSAGQGYLPAASVLPLQR